MGIYFSAFSVYNYINKFKERQMNLTSPSIIASLCEEFGFKFKKKFGQNFLINPEIPKKIALSSLGDTRPSACIEIGPGAGSLTTELAQIYDKVTAFEIDSQLIPVLQKTLAHHDNVTVINSDILEVDLKKYIEDNFDGYSVTVCANLPYYITTPIVMQLFESGARLDRIVVMMQKEVAQRLVAKAGSADYGAITPTVQYYAKTSKLFDVAPGNFMPRPDVTSTVVCFDIHKTRPVSPLSEEYLAKTIKGAFALRRKTLPNSLATEFGSLSKAELGECLEEAGISPAARGETLDLEALCRLADVLYKRING